MKPDIKDFVKEFIPIFESSIDDVNQSFRENLQNDLNYAKSNNLNNDELYAQIFSSTTSTLYGKSMSLTLQAIEKYHGWLLQHYELKSRD